MRKIDVDTSGNLISVESAISAGVRSTAKRRPSVSTAMTFSPADLLVRIIAPFTCARSIDTLAVDNASGGNNFPLLKHSVKHQCQIAASDAAEAAQRRAEEAAAYARRQAQAAADAVHRGYDATTKAGRDAATAAGRKAGEIADDAEELVDRGMNWIRQTSRDLRNMF